MFIKQNIYYLKLHRQLWFNNLHLGDVELQRTSTLRFSPYASVLDSHVLVGASDAQALYSVLKLYYGLLLLSVLFIALLG
jgi:hypothetical protein